MDIKAQIVAEVNVLRGAVQLLVSDLGKRCSAQCNKLLEASLKIISLRQELAGISIDPAQFMGFGADVVRMEKFIAETKKMTSLMTKIKTSTDGLLDLYKKAIVRLQRVLEQLIRLGSHQARHLENFRKRLNRLLHVVTSAHCTQPAHPGSAPQAAPAPKAQPASVSVSPTAPAVAVASTPVPAPAVVADATSYPIVEEVESDEDEDMSGLELAVANMAV